MELVPPLLLLLLVIWLIRRFGGIGSRTELGTIVAVTSRPPPGAPWYYHTYVLMDFQGKRRKLKLSKGQAREFADNYSEGDVGRVKYSGGRLIDFSLARPEQPVRPQTGLRAFVSYAHGNDQEGQMAQYVGEVLETAGIGAWVDRSDLRPGQQLGAELIRQIERSDYFVPILSREYMASEWCLSEFETAANANIPIKPIKVSEGRLVPPPYLKRLYEERAGNPVFVDITARNAPQKLRELAEDMAQPEPRDGGREDLPTSAAESPTVAPTGKSKHRRRVWFWLVILVLLIALAYAIFPIVF